MRLVRCDKHPDREAVATFRVIKLQPVGARPFLFGYSAGGRTVDLCSECATLMIETVGTAPLEPAAA